MTLRFAILAASLTMFATSAMADPIEGMWKRPNGILVKFAACGSSFCATAESGPHAGGNAGKLAPAGEKYAGTLTDLEAGKTYSGKGEVSGNTLTVAGCILGGLFCKSESWTRQ